MSDNSKLSRSRQYGKTTKSDFTLMALATLLLTTLFTTSSPIYPLQPWDDSNVFMTLGRAMLHGKLLYADIFDQKGPVIFFLHELAAWICEESFFGVYLAELVAVFGFMWFSHKTMQLFVSRRVVTLPLVVTLTLLMITSDFFYYGDSVEEFCLPVMAYGLYLTMRFTVNSEVPRRREAIMLGMGLGAIFWMKYTILFFFVAAVISIFVQVWSKRNLLQVGKVVGWAFFGWALVSIAVLIYFASKGTCQELVDTYFVRNITNYNTPSANHEPQVWWLSLMKLTICCLPPLSICMIKVRSDVKWTAIICMTMHLISFTMVPVQIYYFLTLYVYVPLVVYFFRQVKSLQKYYALLVTISAMAIAGNYNLMSLLTGTFPTQAIESARIVNEDTVRNKQLLIYNSRETCLYLLTGQLPEGKYYYIPNMDIPELIEEQQRLAMAPTTTYISRKEDERLGGNPFYTMEMPTNYELVFDAEEKYRYLLLTNPVMFAWNLVWTRPLLQLYINPEPFIQHIKLYKKTEN